MTAEHLLGLAPMAGYTDWPMRVLCYRMGANYACSEMVSAMGLMCAKTGNETYRKLLYVHPEESNTACQLFGSDPVVMGEAAQRVTELGQFSSVDINMGCPAHKVYSRGEGSALLLHPEIAYRIMTAVKENTCLPVTVKTRIGFENEDRQVFELAQAAQTAGLFWICVHGRTRRQMYSGQADWDTIARVRSDVRIPVIANGDITGSESARAVLEKTGCAGMMIGRAAIGNPWVFREAARAFGAGEAVPPTLKERIDTAILQAEWMVNSKGEHVGVCEMRSHIGHYIAGLKGASTVRKKINETKTLEGITKMLRSLLDMAADEEAAVIYGEESE